MEAMANPNDWVWSCDHYLRHVRKTWQKVVQSLNSPLFPPLIGAEPWRAKEESRITCMRMLRTPPFFPQIGVKTIFGRTFQIRLVARFSE